jgi:hypothetical protein
MDRHRMKIKQLSVFVENKAGRLASIASALGEIGVNIRAMSLTDRSEFGVLRLVVDNTDKAKKLLKELGFAVRLSEVIAVEIPDRPGELGRLLRKCDESGLNLEYVYGFVQTDKKSAVLIFRFDDLDKAINAIQSHGLTILKDSSVPGL